MLNQDLNKSSQSSSKQLNDVAYSIKSFVSWLSNNLHNLDDSYDSSKVTLDLFDYFSIQDGEGKNRFINFLNKEIELLTDEGKQKALGATFTPFWLAKKITQLAYNHWNELNGTRQPEVADLCCGAGSFLFAISDVIKNPKYVAGFDVEALYAKLCSSIFRKKSIFSIETKNSLTDLNFSTNGQLSFNVENCSNKFDIIVGNPPYVRSQNLDSKQVKLLKTKFGDDILTGNFDLSIVFILQTYLALKDGGVAALIVPNKILKSKYGKKICDLLSREASILSVVDFGDNQLFDNKTTYTSILVFAKSNRPKVVKVKQFETGQIDHTGNTLNEFDFINLNYENFEQSPWKLSPNENNEIINQMDTNGIHVDQLFNIFQGIRTGDNSVFLSCERFGNGSYQKIFLSGDEIQKGFIDSQCKNIIWPYVNSENNDFVIEDESRLQKNNPQLYSYLLSNKSKLSKRSLDKGSQWFAFSRNQNLNIMHKPKIVARELMPEACFAFDKNGDYVFGSGYSLLPINSTLEECEVWAQILSTDIIEYQLRHKCIQIKDGWFRILKHHLRELRLPVISEADFSILKKINWRNASEENHNLLDNIIAKGFKLDTKMEKELKESIIKFRKHSSLKKGNAKIERPDYLNHLKQDDFNNYIPVELPEFYKLHQFTPELGKLVTFSESKKLPVHNWYKYTQGYSPNLVAKLIEDFKLKKGDRVFDPFCGSGTTLVVAQELGMEGVGCEISPFMVWVTKQKTRKWHKFAIKKALDLIPKKAQLTKVGHKVRLFEGYLQKAYSPNILNQIKAFDHWVTSSDFSEEQMDFLKLSLVSVLEDISLIRKHGSHYRFLDKTDNVGVQKLNIKILADETNIFELLKNKAKEIYFDIVECDTAKINSEIIQDDIRQAKLKSNYFDAVITSPPYLNRNNYLAQQKAEFSIFGKIESENQFKKLIRSTFRSHVEADLSPTSKSKLELVNRIIEKVTLTENNNAKIPHMIAGYFEDLYTTLEKTYSVLKKGGKCAFVVGNSRWGGVVVPVDHLLSHYAEEIGFKVEKILVTRLKGNSPQQMRAFGKIPMRESIVILKK